MNRSIEWQSLFFFDYLKMKYYKYCMVPQCKSTTIKTPNKLFVYVPNKKQIRRKWLKLARRVDALSLSTTSKMYFCEDHFDLPNDMDNYIEYHIMGTVSQVRMKPGCIPRKFECQENKTKRTTKTSSTKHTCILKKERMVTVNKCLNKPEIRCVPTLSLKVTSDTNSESEGKISGEQISILCNFFEENPEVIRGSKITPKCMDEVQNKWKNITSYLNTVGPSRDHTAWRKYIDDIKAKLKGKSIQEQSCHGEDPFRCNTDNFNEISLRMLQILRNDVSQASQDSSEAETGNSFVVDHNEGENYKMDEAEEVPDVKPKLEGLEQTDIVLNDTPPPDLQAPRLMFEDEFEHFGKNVAEQLRSLPLGVALETQEMLLSILKKQRLK